MCVAGLGSRGGRVDECKVRAWCFVCYVLIAVIWHASDTAERVRNLIHVRHPANGFKSYAHDSGGGGDPRFQDKQETRDSREHAKVEGALTARPSSLPPLSASIAPQRKNTLASTLLVCTYLKRREDESFWRLCWGLDGRVTAWRREKECSKAAARAQTNHVSGKRSPCLEQTILRISQREVSNFPHNGMATTFPVKKSFLHNQPRHNTRTKTPKKTAAKKQQHSRRFASGKPLDALAASLSSLSIPASASTLHQDPTSPLLSTE